MKPQSCVLAKYGELAIKGNNREWFEKHLLDNLGHALADLEQVRIARRRGVLVLSSGSSQEALVWRARHVMGISVVQPALRADKNPHAAATAALRLLHERFGETGTYAFAVRARRRDKRFRMNSEQLAAYIGRSVGEEFGWSVDLEHPDIEVIAEVDRSEIFVSVQRQRGQGGLPVGSNGRALVLLSGGFDSPIAAHRMMRRGLSCDFVHFTGAPYTGPSSIYKAYALVRELNRFQQHGSLYVIPVGTAQRALASAGAGSAQIVAHRRLFLRVAGALAGDLDAQALVTGDSLGQVSSQTLSNLYTTEQAASLPLFRPLLAWDKEEIIREARRIGTARVSELADEDCCSLLTPSKVSLHTSPERLARVEDRIGTDELARELLAHARTFTPPEPGASADEPRGQDAGFSVGLA